MTNDTRVEASLPESIVPDSEQKPATQVDLALEPIGRTVAADTQTVDELRIALMRAQTDFIRAQESYIHERDLSVFLEAQQSFINAMAAYLKTVGDIVLADVQEQFIGVQIAALTQVGVL